MSTTARRSEPARYRTVAMLRQSERDKLNALAAREHVSTAEIIRRAIAAYAPSQDDELLEAAIGAMSDSLKGAIGQVREARASVAETRAQLREHARPEVVDGDQ